jgi:phosphoribosylformylglycinamidine cyclo-ligase
MELYVPQEIAADLIRISQSFGIDAQVVGRVEASTKKELSILSAHGNFHYEG